VVLFGIGMIFIPVQKEPPAWMTSIGDWINRAEDSINRSTNSSYHDEEIRKQNDIALAKLHSK